MIRIKLIWCYQSNSVTVYEWIRRPPRLAKGLLMAPTRARSGKFRSEFRTLCRGNCSRRSFELRRNLCKRWRPCVLTTQATTHRLVNRRRDRHPLTPPPSACTGSTLLTRFGNGFTSGNQNQATSGSSGHPVRSNDAAENRLRPTREQDPKGNRPRRVLPFVTFHRIAIQ